MRSSTCCSTPGFLLVCKPKGISSHSCIAKLKRFVAGKIGHTGTLDPFATGMLVVALGEGTKFSQHVLKADKTYTAVIQFGSATDTDDCTGNIIETSSVPNLDQNTIQNLLHEHFCGELTQIPPLYAAIKLNGVPYYRYARKQQSFERPARNVRIYNYSAIRYDSSTQQLHLTVRCGSGTYIRSLGRDIAKALGTCGHLISLHRNCVFPWQEHAQHELANFIATPQLINKHVIGIDSVLSHYSKHTISLSELAALRMGKAIAYCAPLNSPEDSEIAVFTKEGHCVGLCQISHADAELRPKKILQSWPTHSATDS